MVSVTDLLSTVNSFDGGFVLSDCCLTGGEQVWDGDIVDENGAYVPEISIVIGHVPGDLNGNAHLAPMTQAIRTG